ncbi:type II toxin-antitoxin system VapB family antitoxin [Streptomyces sp. NPDC095613]|uniref:type II toxin-antitoxin system VapB family antitoxin n=1 Tax=Streptomyces sp. NPDC095613 TaxID=3155540 RepID=UPI003320503E
MSRTVIDLDDDALEAAARELGTTTKRDTINTALREVTARYRRLRALQEAREQVAAGALDMDLLLDKAAYRGTGYRGTGRAERPDLRGDGS